MMRLLKPEEAAEILGVNLGTVRRWLREGKLKGVKVGRLWRITEEDLKAFIEAGACVR